MFKKSLGKVPTDLVGEEDEAGVRERYIRLLIDILLNEIYLENEVRLLYIFAALEAGQLVDTDIVRRIALRLPGWVEAAKAARQEGAGWQRIKITRAGVEAEV